ncbi:MAG: DnaA N-terminal domain-containing protein, partial [Parachlamydiaceae bacterium]
MSSQASPDPWNQFLLFAKQHCSVTAFGNWLEPIRVLESSDEKVILEIPNVFVKEYLLSNYKKDLHAFLPVSKDGELALEFVMAAPTQIDVVSAVPRVVVAEEEP